MKEAFPHERVVKDYLEANANLKLMSKQDITDILMDCFMAQFFDNKSDCIAYLVKGDREGLEKLLKFRRKEGEKLKGAMLF